MSMPSQLTMMSAFVGLSAVVIALKLIPPQPFPSRIEAVELNHSRFYKPSTRPRPFSILNDRQIQTELLNPTRLEYLGQALRKTLCYRDASTACFSAPHSRVVDVGSGNGIATAELARRYGLSVIGVDHDEQAVAWATEQHASQVYGIAAVEGGGAQGGQVSFRHAEAYVLPFADGSVDGVVAMRLLEEVGDLPRLVRELQRVLKPGGVFAFHTINRSWLAHAWDTKLAHDWLFLYPRHSRRDWRLFVTPSEITRLLRRHAFAVQRADFVGLRPSLNISGLVNTLKLGWGGLLSSYFWTPDLRVEYMGYAILKPLESTE